MLKRSFWILTFVAGAALASAQGDFFHRPSPFAGRTMVTLSLFEEVRTELKTTPEVNSKVDGLLEKIQADIQEAFQSGGGDFNAMRPTIEKINAKYDDQCIKLLTADQATRLKQLFIQYNGASSITQPVISKDLGITDDQKTKIKAAQDDNFKKMGELMQGGGSPEDNAKPMAKLQDDLKDSLEKILTDEQRTKFKTMQGAKFEFKKVAAGGL